MTNQQNSRRPWQISPVLPAEVFKVLRKPEKAINPITIVATADVDGSPRTAPFGSLRAISPRLLRFACLRDHITFDNLCRDARLMVAFLAPPRVAVSIRGKARVIREKMNADQRTALVEVDIEEVKNDLIFRGTIDSGIELNIPESHIGWYLALVDEVEEP
jgi:hypothetical protein